MEIIKDFLTLFLQLTAVLVLVFTAWPIRKPKLQLATAISVLNLDWALRSKTYSGLGECECLSDIVKEIIKEKMNFNIFSTIICPIIIMILNIILGIGHILNKNYITGIGYILVGIASELFALELIKK